MNATLYLFGNLSSGYTQYPDDYASDIFQQFYNHAKSTTQIAVHRDGALMYYAYIRKLEQDKYLGICIVLNKSMFTNVCGLFSLFENTISTLASKGQIIQYSDSGELTSSVEKLYLNKEEVDLFKELLNAQLDQLEDLIETLPVVDYSKSNTSVKSYTVDSNLAEIQKSTYTYGYTYIYKSKDYETAQSRNIRSILSRVNNENKDLRKCNDDLIAENRKIKKQKKQFQFVILLFGVVIVCCFGLFALNNNLKMTKGQLNEANETIDAARRKMSIQEDSISAKNSKIQSQTKDISRLKSTINELQESLSSERSLREETEEEYSEFKDKISDVLPIIITNMSIANVYSNGTIETSYGNSLYSNRTMYLKPKITYTGLKSGEKITLSIRLYSDANGQPKLSTGSSSPSGFSTSSRITVYGGEGNVAELSGWGNETKGHWPAGTYRFEIWYGTVCLKSKTFTIYYSA